MTSFIHRKLTTSKTLPEILREQRLKENLSLDEVSFKTQISTIYLNYLEDGRYDKLPGEVYTKQFIKKLAKTYSLNESSLLKIYLAEKDSQLTLQILRPSKKIKNWHTRFLTPKVIRLTAIIIVILAGLSYLGFEVNNIFKAPLLKILSPQTEIITDQQNIEIIGQTEPEVDLTINNQKILADEQGNFTKKVDLVDGVNVFTISAKKQHSKEQIATLSILRQPSSTNNLN
jgi:cytoskeletal protein RodZ